MGCWLAAVLRSFQPLSGLIAWAEHFGRSLPSGTIPARPSRRQAVHRGPVCPPGSPRGCLQHSHPDPFVFLSATKPPVPLMQIPPGSPCCRVLLGFAAQRSRHGGITPRLPGGVTSQGKTRVCQAIFPVSGFLCNCLGSENHNKGEV